MRLPALMTALVYTAALAAANPLAAAGFGPDDRERLEDLRSGEMRKLIVAEEPMPAPDVAFTDPERGDLRLADTNGKVRLVNFWATWCAPCRKEKPTLDALQRDLGGDDFEVIAIATGRNSLDAIEEFNDEVGVTVLETRLDPQNALAVAMNVPGLPVTVVLDRDGTEIARLMGGADWSSESAREIVHWLIERPE